MLITRRCRSARFCLCSRAHTGARCLSPTRPQFLTKLLARISVRSARTGKRELSKSTRRMDDARSDVASLIAVLGAQGACLMADDTEPTGVILAAARGAALDLSYAWISIGPGGVLLDADGNPLLGADGKPLTLPPCSIGPDGTILDADGRPVLGADGKPIMLGGSMIDDPSLLNDPRIPPGGSVGPGGIILDAYGRPVLGADGKPLFVGDGRLPATAEGILHGRCSIGPGGVLLDADGNPLLGADGKPLTLPPCSIGPDGTILDADGRPVLGADGKPIMLGGSVIDDPGSPLGDGRFSTEETDSAATTLQLASMQAKPPAAQEAAVWASVAAASEQPGDGPDVLAADARGAVRARSAALRRRRVSSRQQLQDLAPPTPHRPESASERSRPPPPQPASPSPPRRPRHALASAVSPPPPPSPSPPRPQSSSLPSRTAPRRIVQRPLSAPAPPAPAPVAALPPAAESPGLALGSHTAAAALKPIAFDSARDAPAAARDGSGSASDLNVLMTAGGADRPARSRPRVPSAPPTTSYSPRARHEFEHAMARHAREKERVVNQQRLPSAVRIGRVPHSPQPRPLVPSPQPPASNAGALRAVPAEALVRPPPPLPTPHLHAKASVSVQDMQSILLQQGCGDCGTMKEAWECWVLSPRGRSSHRPSTSTVFANTVQTNRRIRALADPPMPSLAVLRTEMRQHLLLAAT